MDTRFYQEDHREWFIFRRSRFICEITVGETQAFNMIFSTATTKLKEWYDDNARAAREFELRLSGPPVVLKRAQSAMQELHSSTDSYAFAQKLTFQIVFQNTETGEMETYTSDPK